MSRKNFTKAVKRQAWDRSQMKCEADGPLYGLDKGHRCGVSLLNGVEYDHYIFDANSKDNSLENCRAVCPKCHRYKTTQHDIPKAAKTVRQQDKARGIVREKAKIKSAGFAKAGKPERKPLAVGITELQRRYRSAG